ncbi:hypothetical protein FFF34_016210 [Inquilinus sp. KBS0705]|nr:hypothetical protein FFF34_016210 [Inquilinus sp. KBS0705]
MKKALLLIVLFAASGKLMAQKKQPAPLNNNLNNTLLLQPFKADSSWLTSPMLKGNNNLQNLAALGKLTDYSTNKLLVANNTDHMPVAVLPGQSKMPIAKLSGSSRIPVVMVERTPPLVTAKP